ncbi:hypothetical protein SEUCBS139899_002009 [Sporothrix eucalyptigena]
MPTFSPDKEFRMESKTEPKMAESKTTVEVSTTPTPPSKDMRRNKCRRSANKKWKRKALECEFHRFDGKMDDAKTMAPRLRKRHRGGRNKKKSVKMKTSKEESTMEMKTTASTGPTTP